MTAIRHAISPEARDARMVRQFECTDAWGDTHMYDVRLYPPDEGFDLMPLVVEIVAEPLASLIEGIDLTKGDITVEDLLGGDISILKDGAVSIGQAVQKHGGSSLVKRILKYVRRDGKGLNFMTAYQGNYQEMFVAVYHVIEANYGHIFSRNPM